MLVIKEWRMGAITSLSGTDQSTEQPDPEPNSYHIRSRVRPSFTFPLYNKRGCVSPVPSLYPSPLVSPAAAMMSSSCAPSIQTIWFINSS